MRANPALHILYVFYYVIPGTLGQVHRQETADFSFFFFFLSVSLLFFPYKYDRMAPLDLAAHFGIRIREVLRNRDLLDCSRGRPRDWRPVRLDAYL